MLNLDNPNFEKPSAILRENSRFLVEQNRFTGPCLLYTSDAADE